MARSLTRNSTVPPQNAPARVQSRYSEDDKLRAVTILQAYGGTVTIEALNTIHSELAISPSRQILFKWNRELKDKILAAQPDLAQPELDVAKLVADTRRTLLTNLAETLRKTSKHLNQDKVIDAMSGRDSAVVLGISAEKLLLMAGRSPATDNLIQELTIALREIDEDIDSVLHSMLDLARKRKHDKQQLESSQGKQLTTGE